MTAKSPYKRPISSNLAEMPVTRIMSKKIHYALPTSSIEMAMQIMNTHKVSGLPIADNSGKCLGIYSELDAMLQGASQALTTKIKYTNPAVTVTPDTSFRDILVTMVQKKVKRIPVVDGKGVLLGIDAGGDIMRALYDDHKAQEKLQSSKKTEKKE